MLCGVVGGMPQSAAWAGAWEPAWLYAPPATPCTADRIGCGRLTSHCQVCHAQAALQDGTHELVTPCSFHVHTLRPQTASSAADSIVVTKDMHEKGPAATGAAPLTQQSLPRPGALAIKVGLCWLQQQARFQTPKSLTPGMPDSTFWKTPLSSSSSSEAPP